MALAPHAPPHRHDHRRRNPEIVNPRPPDSRARFLAVLNPGGGVETIEHGFIHAFGKKTFPEEDFVPKSEWGGTRPPGCGSQSGRASSMGVINRAGRALGAPVLVDLDVCPVRVENGTVYVDIG